MQQPFNIYIGYDPVEAVAYHTLCHSILSQSSIPVRITPVNLYNLRSWFQRPRDPKQTNEFSFSRFLVPTLQDYQGWALFMDCDMMIRCDIKELLDYRDDKYAMLCVQHDYEPRDDIKYLGNKQLPYPRKNWSSFVLWNCGHESNRTVRPYMVERLSGLDLHRFTWLKDSEIGSLPIEWNFLVSEYNPEGLKGGPDSVKNVHWTVGGPWFTEYEHVDYSNEWFDMRRQMLNCSQRDDL